MARVLSADEQLLGHLVALLSHTGNTAQMLLFQASVAGLLFNARDIGPATILPLVLDTLTHIVAVESDALLQQMVPMLPKVGRSVWRCRGVRLHFPHLV